MFSSAISSPTNRPPRRRFLGFVGKTDLVFLLFGGLEKHKRAVIIGLTTRWTFYFPFFFPFILFTFFLSPLFFSFSILSLLRLPSFPSRGRKGGWLCGIPPIFFLFLQGYVYWGHFLCVCFGFTNFLYLVSPLCFVVRVACCVFKGLSVVLQKKLGFRVSAGSMLGWAHRIGVWLL